MSDTIIVALIAFLGTVVGSIGGIFAGTKLTEYRLQNIEKRLDDYTKLSDRVYALERHDEVLDTRLAGIEKQISQRFDSMIERQNDFISDFRDVMQGGT